MVSYELVFKKSVAKDLRSIPKKDVARILKRIEALREDPRGDGCLKLSAQERYRVRLGTYRIIYEIRDNELIVMVVKVGHRSSVYKTS
jgi:mRNA interferase RelE/StbE